VVPPPAGWVGRGADLLNEGKLRESDATGVDAFERGGREISRSIHAQTASMGEPAHPFPGRPVARSDVLGPLGTDNVCSSSSKVSLGLSEDSSSAAVLSDSRLTLGEVAKGQRLAAAAAALTVDEMLKLSLDLVIACQVIQHTTHSFHFLSAFIRGLF